MAKLEDHENIKQSEEMQKAIDKYFETEQHITITGLALALDFTSRARSELIMKDIVKDFYYTTKKGKAKD